MINLHDIRSSYTLPQFIVHHLKVIGNNPDQSFLWHTKSQKIDLIRDGVNRGMIHYSLQHWEGTPTEFDPIKFKVEIVDD